MYSVTFIIIYIFIILMAYHKGTPEVSFELGVFAGIFFIILAIEDVSDKIQNKK